MCIRDSFYGVFHLATGRSVQLGDTLVQLQGLPENPERALATSSAPYARESTWTGGAQDLYLVDLGSGERSLVQTGYQGGGSTVTGWLGVRAPALSHSPSLSHSRQVEGSMPARRSVLPPPAPMNCRSGVFSGLSSHETAGAVRHTVLSLRC